MSSLSIPQFITVHLGGPEDASARNIRVLFVHYLKNAASCVLCPTWPENALRASIYAVVTFTLSRVYTNWYPSQGYRFDITNSPQYDQPFAENREIFEPISQIVDEVFNDYVVRQGSVHPLFAQHCDGIVTPCDGLSRWGALDLAREGLSPFEILQYYYGENINIVFNAPTQEGLPFYSGIPMKLGCSGEDVRGVKRQLNRIGRNYPGIVPVLPLTDEFDANMEQAVRKFQRIFNLNTDGAVGKGTWYRIQSIFNSVKGLSELNTESLEPDSTARIFSKALHPGSSGAQVQLMQCCLSLLSYFDDMLPGPSSGGEFDPQMEASVRAFQEQEGLPADGIVNRQTWNALLCAYDQTIASIPPRYLEASEEIYPGKFLAPGQSGREVEILQLFLDEAAEKTPAIPAVNVTGVYDEQTETAVRAVQELEGLPVNGVTGPSTWDAAVSLAKEDT